MGYGAVMLTGIFCALAGFFALALAMNRHYHQLWQRLPGTIMRWLLRALGWAGLLLSLLICAKSEGWPAGTVLWCGLLTATALMVAMFFTYGPVHRR
ncbi:MAG: DUF3325 domain-containing protein [Parahaliea sp.]